VSWYTLAWLAWMAWFVVVEGVALFNKEPDDTLSEHVWKWFRVRDRRPTAVVVAGRVALALFMVWLGLHFVFAWNP
jgi:hypothetical protein